MIDSNHALPITRQARLVGISRGNVYYLPRAASQADQSLMKRIDVIHLAHPFAGSRMLRDMLNREGFEVGRRHVATLMQRMGIEALYRKPNTSKRHPTHKVYPYLLRGLKIDRANQVWATDISRASRWHAAGSIYARSWTGQAGECCRTGCRSAWTPRSAWRRWKRPSTCAWHSLEIFNPDQGSQFTSEGVHRGAPKSRGVQIIMDGRGACRDNIFPVCALEVGEIRRGTLRHAHDSGFRQAWQVSRAIIDFYNVRRPHSSLDKRTPDEFYFASAVGDEGGCLMG